MAGLAVLAVAMVAVVAVHLVVTARLGTYPAGRSGVGQAAVDCTWSLPNTLAGLLFLGFALLRHNRLDRDAGRATGNIRLAESVIPGFATTVGPVIAGAAPRILPHERIHVFQARLFGPFYGLLVGLHYLVLIVLPYWLLYHDRTRRPVRNVRQYFLNGVYRHVWHEVWAYRVAPAAPRGPKVAGNS
jgi:hypothetical protein